MDWHEEHSDRASELLGPVSCEWFGMIRGCIDRRSRR